MDTMQGVFYQRRIRLAWRAETRAQLAAAERAAAKAHAARAALGAANRLPDTTKRGDRVLN